MAKDLSNIEQTKRALDHIKFQIKDLQRIQKQLSIHLRRLLKSKK